MSADNLIGKLDFLKEYIGSHGIATLAQAVERCIAIIRQNAAEPPQDLLEKVARAICASHKSMPPDFEYEIGTDDKPLLKRSYKLWGNDIVQAQAAIDAMRVTDTCRQDQPSESPVATKVASTAIGAGGAQNQKTGTGRLSAAASDLATGNGLPAPTPRIISRLALPYPREREPVLARWQRLFDEFSITLPQNR